jgi:hypothetical protein
MVFESALTDAAVRAAQLFFLKDSIKIKPQKKAKLLRCCPLQLKKWYFAFLEFPAGRRAGSLLIGIEQPRIGIQSSSRHRVQPFPVFRS